MGALFDSPAKLSSRGRTELTKEDGMGKVSGNGMKQCSRLLEGFWLSIPNVTSFKRWTGSGV
ncbi:hypothetical protein MPNT_70020 [Candidatus Methylacidithermus pantelleriae]|uniref:Uncharacterized protein n=1 Tax=Candidatus Methylacidithermus pantelleriae TaxID=2744239 RepID=A0A8J2BSI8_9BACT|nr:hypothetical protein MPNT_70020 [Candidatus Methylacidithermus pantelleriae]